MSPTTGMSSGRPDMAALFRAGNARGLQNSRHQRLFRNLQWRQAFLQAEEYEYLLEKSTTEFLLKKFAEEHAENTSVEKIEKSSVILPLRQIPNGEMKGLGTGTFVWPAAHVLAKYIEKTYRPVETDKGLTYPLDGKLVLDVGSGTGLTGLVAALLGAEVAVTDQAHLVKFMAANCESSVAALYATLSGTSRPETLKVEVQPPPGGVVTAYQVAAKMESDNSSMAPNVPVANLLAPIVEVHSTRPALANWRACEYEWTECRPISSRAADIVLVSDCVLPRLYPIDLLLTAVDPLIGKNTVAYFSYEHRPFPAFDPRQEFRRQCTERGLEVEVIPLGEHHPDFCDDDIEIWAVRRGSGSIHYTNASGLALSKWDSEATVVEATIGNVKVPIEQTQLLDALLWPSCVVASRYFLSTRFRSELTSSMESKGSRLSALDLGAGCGLASMVLHSIGYNVVSTGRTASLNILERNLSAYQSATAATTDATLTTSDFEWSTSLSLSAEEIRERFGSPDLLLCSDCLYDSTAIEPLLDFISKVSTENMTIVFVNAMRTAFEEFLYLLRRLPFHEATIKEIPLTNGDLEMLQNGVEIAFGHPVRMMTVRLTDQR